MSLSPEWFAEYSDRDKQRSLDSISVEEAESDLSLFRSSISPVAEETARWLYKNWTIEKFFQLHPAARLQLLKFVELELMAKQSTAEPLWHKVIETDFLKRNGIK